MHWVLAVLITNDFGQDCVLFERNEGGWGPFISRVRSGTEDQVQAEGATLANVYKTHVYLMELDVAKAEQEASALMLVKQVVYGDFNFLDSVH